MALFYLAMRPIGITLRLMASLSMQTSTANNAIMPELPDPNPEDAIK
jgi:hypothetical protein